MIAGHDMLTLSRNIRVKQETTLQTRVDMIFKNDYVALSGINYPKPTNLTSMTPCFVSGSREGLYREAELYTICDTSISVLSISQLQNMCRRCINTCQKGRHWINLRPNANCKIFRSEAVTLLLTAIHNLMPEQLAPCKMSWRDRQSVLRADTTLQVTALWKTTLF